MAGNSALNAAIGAKKDEFYTQSADIEKEMRYYRRHFKGKTVLCNCDDPFESNFFKYFVLNFNKLKLKKLIATCYAGSPIANRQLSIGDMVDGESKHNDAEENKPYKAVVTTVHDATGDGGIDMLDVKKLFENGENKLTELQGDGDFRSKECAALLDEADIVVTNPPFSLFREYVAQLMEHDKKFIIIGNVNAITYKEVFPLIMQNRMWLGASIHSGDRAFYVPDDYPLNASGCGVDDDGRRFIRVKGVRWYTNLDLKQRHEEMILVKRYSGSEENFPCYDNYNAIDVSMTKDIPEDYAGMMGVPITFLDKYNPDQFEILGITKTWFGASSKRYGKQIQVDRNGKQSLVSKLNDGPSLMVSDAPAGKTYYIVDGKYYVQSYQRILIRNKNPRGSFDCFTDKTSGNDEGVSNAD
ncbi:Modification methylase EcoRI [Bifidobacterium saguini DSM 23967]|uniref:Modification methylase EcoRI n=1 Tax=Bifidobacterium saguini DSM 23967 TaxID=1437607 RepID=A0A087D6W8_9BIFI|nr:adenine-specific methyltransferase EcoRI family protein [Bifidobacterium saguini]KFI91268.1 Modification methylase EcoRI [Bifidobacterium saguini DSM 23967]